MPAQTPNERDIQLMLEVKEKDSEVALRQLYDSYHRPLCKFFYNLSFDQSVAEDYVQEVFLRLWRARKRYRPIGKFSTFLFQIGKNYWLNEKDKRDRRPNVYSMDRTIAGRDGQSFKDQHEAKAPGPGNRLINSEDAGRIEQAINSLPEKLRLVFVMGQIQEMRYREISEVLGIPEGTVKSRMSRAVRALRDSLAPYFDEEPDRSSLDPRSS